MNSSERKFYKTTYTFVVLSEEPIPEEMSFMQVLEETYTGHYSGDVESHTDEVTALEMARLLIAQRSNPEFFGLTELGDDTDDMGDWTLLKPRTAEVLASLRAVATREQGDREFTCDKCDRLPICVLAFDIYNTDGDCLYEK